MDISALGLALAHARGTDLGNREGIEARMDGDNLDKQVVKRLLGNLVFQREVLATKRNGGRLPHINQGRPRFRRVE